MKCMNELHEDKTTRILKVQRRNTYETPVCVISPTPVALNASATFFHVSAVGLRSAVVTAKRSSLLSFSGVQAIGMLRA